MLRSAAEMFGYHVYASDGEIGQVCNFFFDDRLWVVRYLVVETGSWLKSRRVLVSTTALGQPDWSRWVFPVGLSREQIQNSPDIDADMPVSRQQELAMSFYYGWPSYWSLSGVPATAPVETAGDPTLRSMREVRGYRIQAGDGEIGHVEDFILDDQSWALRYIVVETRNWLPGKKVLVNPDWIGQVSWSAGEVAVNLQREAIASAPEYGPSPWVDRLYEIQLYRHYGRPGYWEKD